MKLLKSIKTLSLLTLIAGVLLFMACNKDVIKETAEEIAATVESVEDENVAETIYNGDVDQSLVLAENKNADLFGFADAPPPSRLRSTDSPACATITLDRTEFPITVTIDFGAGCRGNDGRTRRGKIIIVFSDTIRKNGSTATTTFDNFYVDSAKVEGKHILTNLSQPGKPKVKREIINGKLTWPSGRWIERSSEKYFEMVKGVNTRLREDDVFSITGEASGKNSRNKSWTAKITSPLEKRANCRWITKGIVNFQRNDKTGSLDYGSGDCDNKAILKINEFTKEITLR